HLGHQRLRRDHYAVADEAIDALAHDSGGDEVQHRLLAADHQCVPGVVPALEAHHALGAIGKPVDDLALAFVAPLRADDDDVARAAHLSPAPLIRGAARSAGGFCFSESKSSKKTRPMALISPRPPHFLNRWKTRSPGARGRTPCRLRRSARRAPPDR